MSKTIEELRADALRIKNETGEGKNTAARVGGLFEDIVDVIDDYHGGDGSRPTPEPEEGNAVLYEPQNASDYEKVAALNNLHGKAYNAAKKSGLGKVYLDKNNGVLTQAMMSAAHTCYVIMYDYDLDGDEVQVPADCVLQFDGGSVTNGTLVLNNTVINSSDAAFKDVRVTGTVKNDVEIKWFNIDRTGYSDCSPIISQAFSLGCNKIVFPVGTFAFKHIEVNHSVEVCGQPGTVFKALERNEGLNGFDHLFITNCNDVYFHDFEVTGDTTNLVALDGNITYPLFYVKNATNAYFEKIFFNSVHYQIVSPQGQQAAFGEDQFLLLFFERCVNVNVDSCEFKDCYRAEWVGSQNLMNEPHIDFFKFSNNYIHDAGGGLSIVSVNAKTFWLCGNKIKNFSYTGSVFNCHGENVTIKDNVVTDSWATSVFDTSEYGKMLCKSVLVQDNVVSCKNSIMLVTSTDTCMVSGNRFRGIELIYMPPYELNDPTNGHWAGINYVPFPENSFIQITDNYANCNYYEASEEHPIPASGILSGAISNFSNYIKCKLFIIRNNTIICAYDDALQRFGYSRTPMNVGLCDHVYVENNVIDGTVPVPGSRAYCCAIYLYGTDSIRSMTPDRVYNYVSIRGNIVNGIMSGRQLAFYAEANEMKNGSLINTRIKTLDFYDPNNYLVILGIGLSVDVLNADTVKVGGAVSNIRANHVYDTVGLGELQKGQIMRVSDINNDYDTTVLALYSGCITKYDSVLDESAQLRPGSVVSFGDCNWQFIEGSIHGASPLVDILELHQSTGYSVGDLRRVVVTVDQDNQISQEGDDYVSYWRLCRSNRNRVVSLDHETTHGGFTVSRPTFNVGQKNDMNGFCYFDKTLGGPIFYDGQNDKWIDEKGFTPNIKKGTFAQASALVSEMKITASDVGYEFFATDLLKPIYYNGNGGWVDANGNSVTTQ